MNNGYSTYLHYKLILELLKGEHTVYSLSKFSGITLTMVYRIVNTLVDENVIVQTGYRLANDESTKAHRIYKIKEEPIE